MLQDNSNPVPGKEKKQQYSVHAKQQWGIVSLWAGRGGFSAPQVLLPLDLLRLLRGG